MSYALTDEEAQALSGHVRPQIQALVDQAAARLRARAQYPDLAPALAGFIANVLAEARAEGRLVFNPSNLTGCGLCGKRAETYFRGRGSKRRMVGSSMPGFELARRFVNIQGSPWLGGCRPCMDAVLPHLREALRDVRAQLPDDLRAEGAQRYVRRENRRCTKCGWTGHEGQMGMAPSLMGPLYPATCPQCHAGGGFFSRDVEAVDGYVVVEAGA